MLEKFMVHTCIFRRTVLAKKTHNCHAILKQKMLSAFAFCMLYRTQYSTYMRTLRISLLLESVELCFKEMSVQKMSQVLNGLLILTLDPKQKTP
jgi:hypothetical protein